MSFCLDTAHASATSVADGDVTGWLQRWSAGEVHALDALFPLVYNELRRMAARHMRDEWVPIHPR